jgi:hypothetical protein
VPTTDTDTQARTSKCPNSVTHPVKLLRRRRAVEVSIACHPLLLLLLLLLQSPGLYDFYL